MKIKKKLGTSFVVASILTISSIEASAKEYDGTRIENIGERLEVAIEEDGRVAPNDHASSYDDLELDMILNRIGYNSDSISSMDRTRKEELVSLGGEVIETTQVEKVRNYVSPDGSEYEITPENRTEIREKQISDLKELGIENHELSTYNLVDDSSLSDSSIGMQSRSADGYGYKEVDDWYGQITVAKMGETSAEYEYLVQLEYNWLEMPTAKFGDDFGIFWGSGASPKGSTIYSYGSTYIDYRSGGGSRENEWISEDYGIDQSSTYGLVSKGVKPSRGANSTYYSGSWEGVMISNITVSKNKTDETFALSASYYHPWAPSDVNLSISSGALGLSSGIGAPSDHWTWIHNFTVQ